MRLISTYTREFLSYYVKNFFKLAFLVFINFITFILPIAFFIKYFINPNITYDITHSTYTMISAILMSFTFMPSNYMLAKDHCRKNQTQFKIRFISYQLILACLTIPIFILTFSPILDKLAF